MADYLIGLDLGQTTDPSALAILERTVRTEVVREANKPVRKNRVRHYGCRGLKRWCLGTAYTTIVRDVKALLGKLSLSGAVLLVDGTGVGRPVVDMFRQAKLPVPLVPVIITSGQKESIQDGYHQSVDGLSAERQYCQFCQLPKNVHGPGTRRPDHLLK